MDILYDKKHTELLAYIFAFLTSITIFVNPLIHFLILFLFRKYNYYFEEDFTKIAVRGVFVSYCMIIILIYIMACYCFYGTVMNF